MKLSKVEKVILAIFLVIVIFAVGIFTFILPEVNKIADNTLALANAALDKANVTDTLTREAKIDDEIEAAIQQANAAAEKFYDEITPQEADVLVRDILEANHLENNGMEITPFTSSDITVVKYIDAGVQYPLRDYANFNFNPSSDASSDTAAATTESPTKTPIWDGNSEPTIDEYLAYLSTQTQTVGSINVKLEVTGTRDNFIRFLNYVKDLPQATYIDVTSIAYTEETEAVVDDQGNITVPSTSVKLTGTSEVEIEVSIIFYSVEKINMDLIK